MTILPLDKVFSLSITSEYVSVLFSGQMIANTGCKGKWNTDFFEDKEPFKMTQVRFSFRSISMLRNSLVGL